MAGEAHATAQDIDELIRWIEYLDGRLALPPFIAIAAVGLMAFVFGVVMLLALLPLLMGLWGLIGGAGIVALATATVGYLIGRHDGCVAASRIEPELAELLDLVRQTAPALVQQGKLSELRWATIKIQLSRYGI